MLSEQEIARSWNKLFKGVEVNEEVFLKADGLLEHLRPESPLRHRLSTELEELRSLAK